VDQMNVMVYDNTIPSMSDQTQRLGTLEVFWYEHPEWNVSINNITAKGQGTSSMKYWIWNTRYQLDKKLSVITYADGTTSAAGSKWAMTPHLPAGRKFTAKKNYASSMQSHKIGAVNSYTDLIREVGILNEAMQADEKVRVSVWEAPFVCFEKQINEEGETLYVFRGLYTFGPDKGDADTFGYNTDIYPDMLSIEGSDNSPLLTLFRVPWNTVSGRIVYNEEEEAWQYNGQNCFDFGEGKVENIDLFIPAYNCVYQCSPRLKPFNGTLDGLNAQLAAYKNEPYEYWIAKSGDVNQYNVYYFESSVGKFIGSDIGNGTINLRTQLSDYLASDLSAFTPDQLNELFVNSRIQKFRHDAPQYWEIDDSLFFMNNVEFNAGTDERAKNTYPYCFGKVGSKWRWRVDDADTRFDTTNRGLPDKSYSVEVHDKDDTGAAIWNGETNNFFNLMELAFPDEKIASMRSSMTAMQTLGGLKSGNDLQKMYAFYQKYYFDVAQEYFPQNAYNADAKYCYENGKIAYNDGRYTNDTDPVTQSLGDHYLAEQRWITKRILYMMSKYSFGLFSANGTDTIVVRAAGNSIGYDITPAMDMYPAIANGTSIIRGTRTKAGEVCHMEIELGGTGDQQNAIQAASYLQDIGDWHDKNVTGSMIVQGKMLREIRLGHKTAGIVISISSLTLSNCVSLQKLVLSRISTLAGTLNLTACSHLKEVYIDGTSITQLRLPAGGGLELVEFNALSRYLVLKNYPLMKNSGVLIDECAAVITDFFISDCPLMQPIKLLTQIMDAQQGQGAGHSLKRVRAVGFDETYNTSDMLDKLAALADGSYVGLDSEGVAGEDEYPVLDGTLNVYANAYEDSIQALRGTFKRLELNVIGKYFIRFTDKIVAQRVFELWDVNGDGGLTHDEADLITSIPRYFLSGDKNENYKNITSLVGFESLSNCTEIGYGAFENTNLETAVFPPNLKQIYQRAFMGTKIKKANLPDSCTFLASGGASDYMPFYNCSELEEFTMKDFIVPAEKHYVMNKGFSDCPKLKRFKCNSFEYGDDSITTTFALLSFSNCVSLEECDFGELKGHVNSTSYEMFQNTPIAASCVPVNIIKSSGQSYANCAKLKVVVFEGNLDIIGSRMFNGCNSVTVIFKSTTPPTTLEYGGLSNVVAIYVPDTAVSDYKSSVISGYASIIFPLSEYNGYMPTKLYEI
ncbi:leucine-rich repeat domain-containing protein, partial [Bacteroides fragilis]|uniref:leucine-rich repeat protein n=1 Tax=Bacteroides fragilis TaxID=817 RepID=UPI00203066B7